MQFLADHVQMDDVRLYIRDALKEYARLQTFAPRPSWNAVCYTGRFLLEQFGFPFPADREVSLRSPLAQRTTTPAPAHLQHGWHTSSVLKHRL